MEGLGKHEWGRCQYSLIVGYYCVTAECWSREKGKEPNGMTVTLWCNIAKIVVEQYDVGAHG